MSTKVLNYHDDGANRQAQATLAMLQHLLGDGIETSWDNEFHRYCADVRIARWENCREQGYVVSLRSNIGREQLNIAFFEHRNSAEMSAIKWQQVTMNTPTIATAEFGDNYINKYDVSFDVPYGEVYKMAEWIHKQLLDFWRETSAK